MRYTAIMAAVFMCAGFTVLNSQSVSAETDINIIEIEVAPSSLFEEILQEQIPKNEDRISLNEVQTPKEYIVAEGDTLEKIGKAHNTTWQRLYNKNTFLVDPNILGAGNKIVVPLDSEVLTDRPLPVPKQPVQAEPPSPAMTSQTKSVASTNVKRGSSSGNTYYAGYCTWYAKQRRPDLPNNLGNAATWVTRASAQGFATGSSPQAGAIGQQGNHVVYIESVNGNGTVTVSDMNFAGRGVITTRTVPSSSFQYIY